jgi:predicted helicase
MPTPDLRQYVASLNHDLATGGATERTHYGSLRTLLESVAAGVHAPYEQRQIDCGAPDFHVRQGQLLIGHVEAKDVDLSLDEAARTEQLAKRYLPALSNLILTNYLEFRWYVRGELREAATLGRLDGHGKVKADAAGQQAVAGLLAQFVAQAPTGAQNARDLAVRLAGLAREIHNVIIAAFGSDTTSRGLRGLMQAMAEQLLPDLKPDQFADMFAQTLTYGFFAARCHHPLGQAFTRTGAAFEIPKTNPFLRKLFSEIAGPALDDEPFAGYVDDLVQLLAHTDVDLLLADFGQLTGRVDPIVHFYETFLKEYNPKLRELRGVYYTPEPVVSYMVRSVDYLLRERFGCPGGLADTGTVTYERTTEPGEQVTSPRVLILDPACGTGTFLYGIIDHIRERFRGQHNAGAWSAYVRQHLLPRLFGFELLMAPYAVAHLKLGLELAGQDLEAADRADWAYDFATDDRVGIYLTNTLDQAAHRAETLFGYLDTLTEEANAAAEVKHDRPIMVVIGNPPYAGHSANRSYEVVKGKHVPNFIGKLLQDYYQVDGEPLHEKQSKWLQNDYAKFVRFGQWRVEQTGEGILAFITDSGYLDHTIFRGMRDQLLSSFTDIYILNLHGNKRKKERAPDGSRDDGVFDIAQGTAIAIFVKERGGEARARVWYADLWGTYESKSVSLLGSSLQTTEWQRIDPVSPEHLFTPQDYALRGEYESGAPLGGTLPTHTVGFVTARDHFTIHWSAEAAWDTVTDFAHCEAEEARARYGLGNDVRDWKVALAQEDVRRSGPRRQHVEAVTYRPFDDRYTYYTGKVRGFICMPCREVMQHLVGHPNIALVLPKRVEEAGSWHHCIATSRPADHVAVSLKTIDSVFPLYLYPTPGDADAAEAPRTANLSPAFVADLQQRLGLRFLPDGTGDLAETFGPEDVFDYIYAVLHCPTYRSRYAEFLKRDFPRLPLTSDRVQFAALAAKGQELVALHLLESPLLAAATPGFPTRGSDVVERVQYNDNEECVYINKQRQHFAEVPRDVWNFHVGGYQVCDKWLKDRKGRTLSYLEQVHYRKIVVALRETIRVMAEIDALIPEWPMV